jgi:hypothetical protein
VITSGWNCSQSPWEPCPKLKFALLKVTGAEPWAAAVFRPAARDSE